MELTIIILTKNEQKNIIGCLDSIKDLGKALVIDDLSEDDTVDLALSQGAMVISQKLASFAQQRNFALNNAEGEWVFFLDADERVCPELIKAIKEHIRSETSAGSVLRHSYIFGKRQYFGILRPDVVLRLFPKSEVKWEGFVHERAITGLKVKRLSGHLNHYTYESWDKYLEKWLQYPELWARNAFEKGKTATIWTALTRSIFAFGKMFFLKLGILGGPLSWILCWFHIGYTLAKYLRLSEMTQNKKLKK